MKFVSNGKWNCSASRLQQYYGTGGVSDQIVRTLALTFTCLLLLAFKNMSKGLCEDEEEANSYDDLF